MGMGFKHALVSAFRSVGNTHLVRNYMPGAKGKRFAQDTDRRAWSRRMVRTCYNRVNTSNRRAYKLGGFCPTRPRSWNGSGEIKERGKNGHRCICSRIEAGKYVHVHPVSETEQPARIMIV